MRLHSVRISGFKSFADQVTFKMDVPVLCVVGPNGCGKSNIVEAMTWVMGESRASMMRGESMQNVIFNGSSKRKPMDWCSVEMRIDNTDESGADMKMWSGYPELVVKRQLERDGSSTYRINNQVVRRRDVHDLFSGTGLGSHGYSVILQGMVARIVEDNPAHIRVYLEEAAGVTHYKDRRKETEHRLRHSRENLASIENQHDELRGQIATLKRQAAAAVRHRQLSGEIDQVRRISLEWKLKELKAEIEKMERERENKAGEEATLVDRRKALDAQTVELRKSHAKTMKGHQEAQAQAYRMSAAVATTVQKIESLRKERTNRNEAVRELELALETQRKQVEEVGRQQAEGKSFSEKANAEIRVLGQRIAGIEENIEKQRKSGDSRKESHDRIEEDSRQQRHLLQTKEMQLSMTGDRIHSLRSAIEEAEGRFSETKAVVEEGGEAGKEVAQARKSLDKAEKERSDCQGRLDKLGKKMDAHTSAAGELKTESVKLETERKFLMSVEGVHGGDAEGWAKQAGISQSQLMTEQVRINAGEWARAVDAVLGARISAYLVSNPYDYLGDSQLPAGMALVDRDCAGEPVAAARDGLAPLVDRIKCEKRWRGLLSSLLAGHYAVESPDAARNLRPLLEGNEFLVTPRGEVYGKDSVCIPADAHRGYDWSARMEKLTRRNHEIGKELEVHEGQGRQIAARLESESDLLATLDANAEACKSALRTAEKVQIESAARRQWALERGKEFQAQMNSLRKELKEAEKAFSALEAGVSKIKASLDEYDRNLKMSSHTIEAEGRKVTEMREELERLLQERNRHDGTLREMATNSTVLDVRLETATQRIAEIEREAGQQRKELASMDENELGAERERQESHLKDANEKLEQVVGEANRILSQIEANDASRQVLERELSETHDRVQQIGFEESTKRTEMELIGEQMSELKVEVDKELRDRIGNSEQADSHVNALIAKRNRLGDINFAAEGELKAAEERESELELQRQDVNEAIGNLSDAIAKIDREMLERLNEVFRKVSERFDELFRKVFGGGSARLEMEGDSMLDSGVKIKATPPGKTVDRMHLLSGGEKSLVALSFILAIFSLNPAPFCVMDEVDAALDDHNTVMFNNLIREFSGQVQFIVVTHNKITAEVANRLVGVAQPERGVSTLVTVKTSEIGKFVETGAPA